MTIPKKLFHYSQQEILGLKEDFYERLKEYWPEEGCMKPCGLWLSVEDDVEDMNWFEWCKKEEFKVEGLKYRYSARLSDDAKILHISSKKELERFSEEYRSELHNIQSESVTCINWLRVKEKHDGIIISPYRWDCRLSNDAWYYPWDCSSGCIWSLDKVSLKLDSIIDVEALKESLQEESSTDSLLASLVLSA